MIKPNGDNKSFPLPECYEKKYIRKSSENNEGNSPSADKGDEKLFKFINLKFLFSNIDIKTCIPIVNIYLGRYKVYIYTVEEGNILKRSLISPDGEQINSRIIVKTKLVSCFLMESNNDDV